jgi:ribulose-bisphosphate carboxylase large chain
MSRLSVAYHVRCSPAEIDARAEAIALEQSVELPRAAIFDRRVLRDIAGEVETIRPLARNFYEVRIRLALDTLGNDAGQLMNMAFGNSSIHHYVELADLDIPEEMARRFGGPGQGLAGLRARAGARTRALTCTALKPQGLSPDELAALAHRLALGRIDFIKDDHSLADQVYSPFAERVSACARAVAEANRRTGGSSRYAPNLSGDLDSMRAQLRFALAEGIDTVLIAPMVCGLANFHRLTRDFPDIAFIAHPSMAGAARIAPALLLGKLFRLLGADAIIFPNRGGRFAYSAETCRAIASAARREWHGLKPCAPAPAGGMTLSRVPEILDFYGPDTMLLIGGGLLKAADRLTEEALAFTSQVAEHAKLNV